MPGLKLIAGTDVEPIEEAMVQERLFETETRKIEAGITAALTALCSQLPEDRHPDVANSMAVHLLHVAMCLRSAAVVEAAEQSTARVVH